MSSNDEYQRIYYQLCDGQNNVGGVDRIELTTSEIERKDIGELRRLIYENRKGTLQTCGVGDLSIYAKGTTVENYTSKESLDIRLPLSDDQFQGTDKNSLLVVVPASPLGAETHLINTVDKSRSHARDSKLRYIRGGNCTDRLSYEMTPGNDTFLSCPQDSTMACTDIPNYKEIWEKIIADGKKLQFGCNGEMIDATRRNVQDALNELKEPFNENYYDVSIGLLVGKHITSASKEMGEMFFQQLVYNLFSCLLLAASVKDENFKADELVTSLLSCKFREMDKDGHWETGDFQVKPDAASTLATGYDPFAMIELKRTDPNSRDATFDEEKCIAMLCSTLIALAGLGVETSQLYLPFIIGHGFVAFLYVVDLRKVSGKEAAGIAPTVTKVQIGFDLENKEQRTQLFVALSVLLHNIKTTLANHEQATNNHNLSCTVKRSQRTQNDNAFTSSKRTSAKRKSTEKESSSAQKNQKTSGGEVNKNKEDLASEAARCNGLFYDINLPWLRPVFIGEDFNPEYQESSPYYFHGMHASTGKKCFLKIWREDEEGFHDARNEIRFLKQAQNHDVAVAKTTTEDLVPVSVHGIKFQVLAIEYVESSLVSSVDELFDFSLSLIGVVSELHAKAGVLHCDIKPNNVRWHSSRRQVYLIDFGHAQLAEGAQHYKATKDFEAPELRENNLPHSRETDTYSVGETILWAWDDYRRRVSLREGGLDSRMKKLRVVGELLSAPLHDRVSLNDAKDALLQTLEECKNGDELLSSCGKRPRLEDAGLLLQQDRVAQSKLLS
eukprot:CAMPEP_0113619752 /NCGR_PEP_ID=MMETSP0017_2-20120614/10042_1 /TAXON_ID=2856 /ORGANISM="Cylindrotheca closterium" /LENGTH=781 /DNA_ID=CAMNT_0000529357 /DNA_START=125 /DNA_END=2470 /DNA_ORIENTATION=+ /assembly_acc=CAM_ASM_000147